MGVCAMFIFLMIYTLAILLVFSSDRNGRRRRWAPLDYVWVPLGGVTGVCLLVLWWQMR